MSGGLDSQLAVKVLQSAGAEMEGVVFETPFFSSAAARKAAAALGIRLHVVDFTDDIIALVENPPHGFGSAINPCIDCHSTMIRRAGELMVRLGFDFVSTGEVLKEHLADTWGYTLDGYYTVYCIDGTEEYKDAVEAVMEM